MAWGTVSLTIPRLLKTTSFKLGALCSLLFAFCFGLFLTFTYLTTTHVLRDQLRTRVSDELNAFVTEANSDGTDTVVQDIKERLARPGSLLSYYYVGDARQQKRAGNMSGFGLRSGWQELDAEPAAALLAATDEDHQIWGQGQRLADGAFIFVGQDAYHVLAAQEAIINTFMWSGGLALVLAIGAGLAVSISFLRRIDDINKTSLAIIDGQLKERIPVHGSSDEFDKLSGNLNRLFDSNDALLDSLKNVTTNIAHDLRTPLSRLRHKLDEAQNSATTIAQFRGHITSALEDSDKLLSTFAALLRIAQVESGSRRSGFATVDLSSLFERVANVYRAVIEDDAKFFQVLITPGVSCHGDAELLLLMIVNLLENAIRHTPEGTTISLTLNTQNAIIADSGPGIEPGQRTKAFERFWRTESSRTTPGHGLGLALVAAIAELHEIRISLDDNQPGLKVTVQFTNL